ncbi:hypothetical protein L227DRAFT_320030 [Lentinus tigrinus ALCF2SS1-6]|uniref:Uncharacterized protein n=1 Tax=Lentinus tigrinus ALCF2SS1-6 TaxID=1328759 RepID=A0A5C2SLJ0_9APHY|nr:hypothetical protein L227DRAFT_320030 [Lentinus tigrinus ALCF2SS1-6]
MPRTSTCRTSHLLPALKFCPARGSGGPRPTVIRSAPTRSRGSSPGSESFHLLPRAAAVARSETWPHMPDSHGVATRRLDRNLPWTQRCARCSLRSGRRCSKPSPSINWTKMSFTSWPLTRLAGRAGSRSTDTTRGSDAQGSTIADYPTLQSLVDPLTTYFRILIAACTSVYDLLQLADGSHQYLSQLVAFEGKYEWAAVLAYHFDFYRAQVREMKRGNYAGWAQVTVNAALHVRHLAGREKGYAAARTPSVAGLHKMDNSSDEGLAREGELCDLFNPGVCASPCRYRRIHQCQGCGSYEHPIGACPRVVVYSTQRPMHA